MAALAERLAALTAAIAEACARAGREPAEVQLIAVSKLQPAAAVAEALAAGQRDFGENYAQELRDKRRELAPDPLAAAARWHFIGPLQRNKAHLVVGQTCLIHSVDSLALVQALAARAQRLRETSPGFVQDCLIQVSVAGEAQKAGCDPAELPQLLDDFAAQAAAADGALRCRGLMCIPPAEGGAEAARPHFQRLRALRDAARVTQRPHVDLLHLSMGMSQDYAVAIAEGATLVRVGTAIFGARPAHA